MSTFTPMDQGLIPLDPSKMKPMSELNLNERTEWQTRMGVGESKRRITPQPETRKRAVVADDGPLRGKQVGHHTDHKDGRVDAVATSATFTTRPLTVKRDNNG